MPALSRRTSAARKDLNGFDFATRNSRPLSFLIAEPFGKAISLATPAEERKTRHSTSDS